MLDNTSTDAWLEEARSRANLRVRRISLGECRHWSLEDGALVHSSGGFFSVRGLRSWPAARPAEVSHAPFIDQPDVGHLGFLIREAAGGIEWLLQAKTEPGNLLGTEIAPTVQATQSNLNRLHGGKATRFIEHFEDPRLLLSASAQSEQGNRFLLKFLRNSVAALPKSAEIESGDYWRWTPAEDLRRFLGRSSSVNTDARSVIASGPWWAIASGRPLFRSAALMKSYGSPVQRIRLPEPQGIVRGQIAWERLPLEALPGHSWTDEGLMGPDGWLVTLHDIAVNGREVESWCQPLLCDSGVTDITLLARLRGDTVEVFLSRQREVGFGGRWEYGPSVLGDRPLPSDIAAMLQDTTEEEVASMQQTDEGGRFMQVLSRYRIVLVQGTPPGPVQPSGVWVQLSTLEALCRRSGSTTNELRSLASLLLSTAADEGFVQRLGG